MMRRAAGLVLLLGGVGLGGVGCAGRTPVPVRTPVEPQFFTPASMRLSPVFTKITDFDGDTSLDGVEAVVELQDRFGDPTKAAGRILFQLYHYKRYSPDPRGDRLAGPFEGRVDSVQDQKARWSRVNRAYIFQLAFPLAALDQDYVLEAMFESTEGGRLFDRLVIEGDHTPGGPTTGPAPINGPTTAPATAPAAGGATPATRSTSGSITTQEYRSVPATSQPHEPPPRADRP